MSRHHLTPEILHEEGQYELINEISYQQIKPFVLETVRKRSPFIMVFSIIQLICILAFGIILGYGLAVWNLYYLKWLGLSIVISVSVLVAVHELIHALAFILLGKHDIGFGAQWRKFIFYAEANKQVVDRTEISIIALMPLVIIGLASSALVMLFGNQPVGIVGLGIFLIHPLFCAGDVAMVSYFFSFAPNKIYSYDDREKMKSYFFLKRKAVPGRNDPSVLT